MEILFTYRNEAVVVLSDDLSFEQRKIIEDGSEDIPFVWFKITQREDMWALIGDELDGIPPHEIARSFGPLKLVVMLRRKERRYAGIVTPTDIELRKLLEWAHTK